jgi:hypothetical protein
VLWGPPQSDDGEICVLTHVGASSLDTFIGYMGIWTAWWLAVGVLMFLVWRPRWGAMSSTIYNDESRQHGAMSLGGRRVTMDASKKVALSDVVVCISKEEEN